MFLSNSIADRKRDRKLLQVLTVIAWAGLAVNAVVVFWGSRRGFDLTDEGYYWLNFEYFQDYPAWSGFSVG